MPGYHGATIQTLGINGDLGVSALWGPLTVEAERIPAPLTFRAPSPLAAADRQHRRARSDDRPPRRRA